MKTKIFITILALISLVSGFTSDVKAQGVKQDSVVFYKDTFAKCSVSDLYSWSLRDINDNEIKRVDSCALKMIIPKLNNVKITRFSILVQYLTHTRPDINDLNIIKYTDNNQELDIKIPITISKDTVISIAVNSNNVEYVKIDIINCINQIWMKISNVVINYEYDDKTSIDNIKSNIQDIKYINNKFESRINIDNIKVFDISGKLIQEGVLNDIYHLEKNTLYFILFDNKYSKKIISN